MNGYRRPVFAFAGFNPWINRAASADRV